MRRISILMASAIATVAFASCKQRASSGLNEGDVQPVTSHTTANGQAFDVVDLFFATNRNFDKQQIYRYSKKELSTAKTEALASAFGNDRSYPEGLREVQGADRNKYGQVQVTVPTSHRQGRLETRGKKDFSVAQHIGLFNIFFHETAGIDPEIKKTMANSSSQDILVMIHGFNVNFEAASLAYGTFVYDVGFRGVPVLYSWASSALPTRYAEDEDTVRWSEVDFGNFMERMIRLRAETGGKLHILAHSMGNRLLIDYLYDQRNAVAAEGGTPIFENVFFAAPDVDGTEFSAKFTEARHLSKRFTLYANENDVALKLSNTIHNAGRSFWAWLGQGGGPTGRAGSSGDHKVMRLNLDTIDLTPLHVGGLHHSDFASNPRVIEDINSALVHDMDIDERVTRNKTLAEMTNEYKRVARERYGNKVTFFQFTPETHVASFIQEGATPYQADIMRLNGDGRLYAKLFQAGKFIGDHYLQLGEDAGRVAFIGQVGSRGNLALYVDLCRMNYATGNPDTPHVALQSRGNDACRALKELATNQ